MKVSVPLFSIGLFVAVAVLAAEPAAPPTTIPATGGAVVQNVSPPPPDKIPDLDPRALYGGDIMFDVVRKGSKVGEHRMTFSKDANGDLNVRAEFHLAVEVLFIKAYTFDYTAHEIWRGKQLVALAAKADDDGEVTETKARVEDGVFKINSSRHGDTLASSWVFATNHWNRGQVESNVLLNTLTGKLDRVKIENVGQEIIATAGGPVEATHFLYTGELHDTDTWYDKEGRWVKMNFKAKDGSVIEYICRRCGIAVGE